MFGSKFRLFTSQAKMLTKFWQNKETQMFSHLKFYVFVDSLGIYQDLRPWLR